MSDVNAVLSKEAAEFQPGTDFWTGDSQITLLKVLNQIRKYHRGRRVFDAEILTRKTVLAKRRLSRLSHCPEALQQRRSRSLPARSVDLAMSRDKG